MLRFQPIPTPTRALITGGMGFVGSHLAEALLEKGYRVTVADNLSTGRFENIQHLVGHPSFRFAVDDVNNEHVIDRLVSDADVVFHMAAAVGVQLIVENPIYTVENNVLGTDAVLKAAARYRAKVMLASTSEVYGKGNRIPFTEDDDVVLGPTARSRWSYAASKMVDEFMGLAYYRQRGLPVVIFRLFNTVGPRQVGHYGMVIPRFVERAIRGEALKVYGDGQQSRCFLHVEDAVAGIVALAETPTAVGQVFNIGSSEEITILNLARQVLQQVDAWRAGDSAAEQGGASDEHMRLLDDRLTFVPYKEAYADGFEDMRRRVPNTAKLSAYTGWQQRKSLQQTLDDVIEEFAAHYTVPVAAAAD
ncbi:MAG: GDP-mannose 4,6-dehydratase [Caldilineaceae bacterium]